MSIKNQYVKKLYNGQITMTTSGPNNLNVSKVGGHDVFSSVI